MNKYKQRAMMRLFGDAAPTPEAKDVERAVKYFGAVEKDFWKFKKSLDELQSAANADNINKIYSLAPACVRLGRKIADAINRVTSQIEDIK